MPSSILSLGGEIAQNPNFCLEFSTSTNPEIGKSDKVQQQLVLLTQQSSNCT